MTAPAIVMKRTAFTKRHTDQLFLGGIGGFFYGFRHFAGLAVAKADPPTLITDHHQGCETKPASAFHHFGDPVDVYQTIYQLTLFFVPSVRSCH